MASISVGGDSPEPNPLHHRRRLLDLQPPESHLEPGRVRVRFRPIFCRTSVDGFRIFNRTNGRRLFRSAGVVRHSESRLQLPDDAQRVSGFLHLLSHLQTVQERAEKEVTLVETNHLSKTIFLIFFHNDCYQKLKKNLSQMSEIHFC